MLTLAHPRVGAGLGIVGMLLCTVAAALVRIPLPFTPVPATLQTMAVLCSGMVLGPRKGALTQVLYVCIGALGIPVFAQLGAGSLYLAGPTAGYLFGFIPAAWCAGWLVRRLPSRAVAVIAALACADALLFVTGACWLKIVTQVSWKHVWLMGVAPFVPAEMVKIACAAALYRTINTRRKV
jgi:biotin transport system substrate-specific component